MRKGGTHCYRLRWRWNETRKTSRLRSCLGNTTIATPGGQLADCLFLVSRRLTIAQRSERQLQTQPSSPFSPARKPGATRGSDSDIGTTYVLDVLDASVEIVLLHLVPEAEVAGSPRARVAGDAICRLALGQVDAHGEHAQRLHGEIDGIRDGKGAVGDREVGMAARKGHGFERRWFDARRPFVPVRGNGYRHGRNREVADSEGIADSSYQRKTRTFKSQLG